MKHKAPQIKREGIQRLGDNPAFQAILDSRKAKEAIEPDNGQPVPPMQPLPEDFKEISYYPEAGLRVIQSRDQATCGLQFSEDWKVMRGGLNSEVETLAEEYLQFKPDRRIWTRESVDAPHANLEGMKRLGAELAEKRTGAVLSR